jgi:two-component system OmpR family sensor kinase
MLSSLRVRLPLLFLAGIVLAGIVSALIAIQLLRSFARAQTISELRSEATGIADLYQSAVQADFASPKGESRRAPTFARKDLDLASGDLIYFDGPVSPFPGESTGLPQLNLQNIDWTSGRSLTFQFHPIPHKGTYDAVAAPVRVGGSPIGAIIIAKKTTQTSALAFALLRRLALAGIGGLLVAAALALYLSRRLVAPLLALSREADRVAGGDYDVAVPGNAAGEIGRLAERFAEMAERLKLAESRERNFLMSVSHELRTPLTAIRGHVAALSEGLVESPELRARSLETVEAEVNRLERLVGDILDLARLDAHRFTVLREEVGMEHLVERAFDTFSEQARQRGIDYDLELSASPVIVSDGDRVLQIVGNLLSNAFRATPDGGRIRLELAQDNGSVHVSVADTGPGIAAADRERLFRPFFSGGNHGTGLGLTIARELSLALGGRIEFDSELGRGSRFELILPA